MTESKTFPSVTPRQVQAANWPGSGIDPGSTFLVPPGRIKTCLDMDGRIGLEYLLAGMEDSPG